MLSYKDYLKENYPDVYDLVYSEKKTPMYLLKQRFDEQYFCPVCGERLLLEDKVVCFGHGDYYPVVWLECSCGIRFKEFVILSLDHVDEFFLYFESFR